MRYEICDCCENEGVGKRLYWNGRLGGVLGSEGKRVLYLHCTCSSEILLFMHATFLSDRHETYNQYQLYSLLCNVLEQLIYPDRTTACTANI